MPKIQAEICCGKLLRKTPAENCFGRLLRKTPAENSCGKVWRPLTIWAQQNLQLLTSSKSGWRALVQILVDSVDSRTCRPQVIWRLRPLCFYGRRLSRTVPACCTGTTCQNFCRCQFSVPAQIFTISCEKSKTLSRLLSVLSLHRKFVHDHCCCPNSATILTGS